jgi:trehalose 6-phosphate phosphatase
LEPEFAPDVLERCLDVLRAEPAGLLTDIDGTISEIAATPDEAVVVQPARDALFRLNRQLALVGVVTGRSAASGEALVKVPGLAYVGNHGLERTRGGSVWRNPHAVDGEDAVRTALIEIGELAREAGLADGVVVEDKRLSGSVHYRLTPDPEAARDVLLPAALAAAARHGLRVTEGRLVIELRPLVQVNKGTATSELVDENGLRGLVFLGDDLTDVDAFLAVRRLRDAGRIQGVVVGVLAEETLPAVLDASDVTVPNVGACVALLCALADRCEAGNEGDSSA